MNSPIAELMLLKHFRFVYKRPAGIKVIIKLSRETSMWGIFKSFHCLQAYDLHARVQLGI